jgi:hypothetical protein
VGACLLSGLSEPQAGSFGCALADRRLEGDRGEILEIPPRWSGGQNMGGMNIYCIFFVNNKEFIYLCRR